MRRWIIPAVLALLVAVATYHTLIVAAPSILMQVVLSRVDNDAGLNNMVAMPLVTAAVRKIPRPSPDLAYSVCAFDVSAGPVVIEVPPVPAPYWSLSVFTANTDVAFVRNNIQADGQLMKIAVVGEGEIAPAGYDAVTVDKPRGVVLLRILVPDREALVAIDQARRAAACHLVAK